MQLQINVVCAHVNGSTLWWCIYGSLKCNVMVLCQKYANKPTKPKCSQIVKSARMASYCV